MTGHVTVLIKRDVVIEVHWRLIVLRRCALPLACSLFGLGITSALLPLVLSGITGLLPLWFTIKHLKLTTRPNNNLSGVLILALLVLPLARAQLAFNVKL